jgi:DNA replication protein DnaC
MTVNTICVGCRGVAVPGERFCQTCIDKGVRERCYQCKSRPRAAGSSLYCQTCIDREAEKVRIEKRRQLAHIQTPSTSRMYDWTLATFPATDQAGRRALEAIDKWLVLHTWSHRFVDGAFVEIDVEGDDGMFQDDDAFWDAWNSGNKPSLYLYGGVGSGKTGLAWSLLKARLEYEYDYEQSPRQYPSWANVIELLDQAKAAMSAGDQESPIRALYDSALLVLDDLGAERPTDWALDAISALVQHRHSARRPNIVTSNYSPSELAKRLGHADPVIGQRIVSRLVDNCVKVRLDRPDLRLNQRLAAV